MPLLSPEMKLRREQRRLLNEAEFTAGTASGLVANRL
jgi:hypothetical protein